MKKKKKILVLLLLIILLISLCIFIKNKILLNANEKEILSVLKDVDYSLRNPEDNEDNENTFNVVPTEPTSLKELITTIYEAKKYSLDDGTIGYLFKASLISDSETILVVCNGKLTSMTIDNKLLENNNDESKDGLSYDLTNYFLQSFNNIITEKWDNSTSIKDVNFSKILKKI